MAYRINTGHLLPYEPVEPSKKNKTAQKDKSTSFKEVFNNTIENKSAVKISSHAQQRLQQRNIVLNDKDMDILKNAMEKAEVKGARESVLFYKDTAFITSIRNRTIITAVDANGSEQNVFTNIDSAVIVD